MLDMTTAELLISKNREKILTSLTSKLKDQFMKASVDFDFAFKSYLSKSYEKYSKIKTLIYKIEPKFIYDFFECNDLVLENQCRQLSEQKALKHSFSAVMEAHIARYFAW